MLQDPYPTGSELTVEVTLRTSVYDSDGLPILMIDEVLERVPDSYDRRPVEEVPQNM